MVGDTDDYSLAQQISAAVADAVNTCGEITITQLACLLSKCSLVISNDSAPMHIAWAVNTPVIAILARPIITEVCPARGAQYSNA